MGFLWVTLNHYNFQVVLGHHEPSLHQVVLADHEPALHQVVSADHKPPSVITNWFLVYHEPLQENTFDSKK